MGSILFNIIVSDLIAERGAGAVNRCVALFKKALEALLLAGLILLLVGAYYLIVKAGIPYQDPPLELQLQYAVNTRIGEVLTALGLWLAMGGAAARFLIGYIVRRRESCKKA